MDTIAREGRAAHRRRQGATARQHRRRAGDGERHLGARLGPARAGQPGHDELERVQHRQRGDRRWDAPDSPRPRRADALRRVRRSEPHTWAGFDAMRVLARQSNDDPERASRPMSASAGGFVPGAGAGVVLLESLDSALARGARIHAEVQGGAVNCGGHRSGGSMTAPNPGGVRAASARRSTTRALRRRRSTRSTGT